MYELSGSQFERGILELRLSKVLPAPFSIISKLGPIRARFIVLITLLVTALATFKRQPLLWFIERGYLQPGSEALSFQTYMTTVPVVLAMIVYICIFLMKPAESLLVFDKAKKELKIYENPAWRFLTPKTFLVPFEQIKSFEVFAADKEPKTSFGYLSIGHQTQDGENVIKFKLLSDDQLRIYPLNLARILGRNPVGDWHDESQDPVNS